MHKSINITTLKILQVALGFLLLGQSVLMFSNNPEMSQGFDYMRVAGKLLLPIGFITLLLPWEKQVKFQWIFLLCSIILLSDSVFAFTQNKYVPEQLIEHALKIGFPVLYIFHTRIKAKSLVLILKLLSALTFIGHGIFAIGLHFVPGGFIQMTQNILGFNTDGAETFLLIAGILDFIVAFVLFIKPLQLIAMVYMVFWGVLTSLARFVGYYYHAPIEEVYSVYLFESIWRAPHFMAPLLLVSLYIRGVSFSITKEFFKSPEEVLSH